MATGQEYLSGDVVSKLQDVKAVGGKAFEKNIEALTAVQPTPKTLDQITPSLGAHWLPPELIGQFIQNELGGRVAATVTSVQTSSLVKWQISAAPEQEAAGRRHAMSVPYGPKQGDTKAYIYGWHDLLLDALNLKAPTLGHTIEVPSESGKGTSKKFIKDAEATLAARGNLEDLRHQWVQWLYSQDDATQQRVADIYNTRYHRVVSRPFNGDHLANYVNAKGEPTRPDNGGVRSEALPGLSLPFLLHPHQLRAIWRALTTGNTLLAHEVGAGKTFEMAVIAMEMRRTGRARKPLITVPTHLLAQWREAIHSAYPGAKVLAFDENDLDSKKRQTAMARIAYGDWDIVLVPHSSFGLLKVSPQRMVAFLTQQVNELLAAEKANTSNTDGVKAIERKRKKLQEKLAVKVKATQQSDDNAIWWEELGVDALMVDEAQHFKNLFFYTEMDQIRGLSRSESDRALDMFIKMQDINQATNYRNVVLGTATPMMNSIAEVFTMQRYLQPQRLEEHGFENFDNWYRMFGEAKPNTEQLPDGTYHEVMRLKKFRNLDLLYRTVAEVMDYIGWEDMPYLKLPKLKGGRITIVETAPHPMYEQLRQWFAQRLATLKEKPPWYDFRKKVYHAPYRTDPLTGESTGRFDNILTVMNDAKLAAIDVRLVLGNRAQDFKGSRLQSIATNISTYYKEESKAKGVALVFLDVGTPKKEQLTPLAFLKDVEVIDDTEGGTLGTEEEVEEDEETTFEQDQLGDLANGTFNLYDALRRELIRRGIPEREIAFIHQARNAAERLALFEAVNEGKVRVLIASTEKGGTGMNVQTRLGALFEMDVPRAMRPGDIRQREGRGIRQGNTYDEIDIQRSVTKGSTDEWLYGLLSDKQNAVTDFMRGNLTEYKDQDPTTMSIEEAQARASNDPRVIELTTLRGQIGRLEAQAAASERAQVQATADIATITPEIAALKKDLAALQAWTKASFTPMRGATFEIQVGKETYTKREDANAALKTVLERLSETRFEATSQWGRQTSPVETVAHIGGLPVTAFRSKMDYERISDVQVVLSAEAAGIGDRNITAVNEGTEKEAFGHGRDFVASIVNRYNDLANEAGNLKNRIEEKEDRVTRAHRTLDKPLDVIQKAKDARARITSIEEALKVEGVAKGAAALEDVKARTAEQARRAEEKKLAEQQAREAEEEEKKTAKMATTPAPIPAAPVSSRWAPTKAMRPDAIVAALSKALGGTPIKTGHFLERAYGVRKRESVIRVRVANNLRTIFHEAGHDFDMALLRINRADPRWKDELRSLGQPTSKPTYSQSAQRKEGAAEFFVLYLTDPPKAQQEAPNYFAEFETRMRQTQFPGTPKQSAEQAKARADLRAAIDSVRRDIQGYLGLSEAERGELRISRTPTGKIARAKEWLETSLLAEAKSDPRQALRVLAGRAIDRLHAFNVAVTAMQNGTPLSAHLNGFILASNAQGSTGIAQDFIENGPRGKDGQFLGPSLAAALTPAKNHLDVLGNYLVARHAIERWDRNKNPGISRSEAEAIITKTEAHPAFADIARSAQLVYDFNDALLEYMHIYGMLNEAQVKRLRDAVPGPTSHCNGWCRHGSGLGLPKSTAIAKCRSTGRSGQD